MAGVLAALPQGVVVEDPRYLDKDYEIVMEEKFVEKLIESINNNVATPLAES